jgi:small subunit ribosomal protein S3
MSARVMAEYIAQQLERRMPYRRVIKSVIEKVMAKGLKGIKVQIGGRLNGAEMARKETFKDGRIPLQTLRADVDYHYTTALTKYGILGIKVWIYKGDIEDNKSSKKTTSRRRNSTKARRVSKK